MQIADEAPEIYKAAAGFTVRAIGGRACSIGFDYRIVAKRLGYEDEVHRLRTAAAIKTALASGR